jgi:3,4-dihydroxy 2-butanone 4-phosphate synthase
MSESLSTGPEKAENADELGRAIEALQLGHPILIYDDDSREGETDLVFPAHAVSPSDVALMRNDAGGLICVALAHRVARTFDLPFIQDLVNHAIADSDHLGYDERSSFSLTVNHRETRTGITDRDRAKTISEIATAAADLDRQAFDHQFRTPGHVHLLKAARGLLEERRGHTELGVALARAAEIPPAVVVCEMLDETTGRARSKESAKVYAQRFSFPFLDGEDIVAGINV